MNNYIQNILPRLQQYSQSLNRKEIFLDYPWVRIDEQGNKETYIFKRSGELILSFNGAASIGKWEILIAANSLLIDRGIDKLLLKHDFIDDALMVLKRDDFHSSPFVLMNSNIIQDLNAERYLKTQYPRGGNISQPTNDSNFTEAENETDVFFDRENIIALIITLTIIGIVAVLYWAVDNYL